jgi:hypothetical protein
VRSGGRGDGGPARLCFPSASAASSGVLGTLPCASVSSVRVRGFQQLSHPVLLAELLLGQLRHPPLPYSFQLRIHA